jgi:hypothetical protein
VKFRKSITTALFACLFSLTFSLQAETHFSDQMTMEDAVDSALKLVDDSVYKEIEVLTEAGRFSGELVKRSGDVMILKTKTGSIHLKTNKEKINYVLVNIKSIVGISFYSLD